MAPDDLEEVALKVEQSLQEGREESFWPIPTGFNTLDDLTGGGLFGGDLTIVGGVQNIGKTALILQWANNIAGNGDLAIVVCYEHSTKTLWERLICQNSFAGGDEEHITMDLLRDAYIGSIQEREGRGGNGAGDKLHMLDEVLSRLPNGVRAWARLSEKMHNIWLASGDGLNTDLEALSKYVELAINHYKKTRIVLFVDYIQRVPVIDTSRAVQAEERIERVLAGDDSGIPIVRWGVEKNRRGKSNLEFRHRYHGAAYWFEPRGVPVVLDESWQLERDELRVVKQREQA
jgi:hypothetical protein